MTQPVIDAAVAAASETENTRGAAGQPWGLLFGTATSPSEADSIVQVHLDGDAGASVPMIALVGDVGTGDRVCVVTVPPSGSYVTHIINSPYPRLVKRAERLTQSTPAAGSTGVLRIEPFHCRAGRLYTVLTSSLAVFSSVAANTTASVRLAYTTDGTNAGTGSTIISLFNSPIIPTVADGTSGVINVNIPVQTSDFQLSVVLYTLRLSGTGLVSVFGNSQVPIEIFIYDWGPDLGDVGVDL